MSKPINVRQLKRTIERRYPSENWIITFDGDVAGSRAITFMTPVGHIIGVLDRGDYMDIYDNQNSKDTPDMPTLRLQKGKKLRVL